MPHATAAVFSFDGGPGGTGTEITTAENWSTDVLPKTPHSGTVGTTPAGIDTVLTLQSFYNYDITFYGDSELTRGLSTAQRLDGVLTFEDSSSFNAIGANDATDNFVMGKSVGFPVCGSRDLVVGIAVECEHVTECAGRGGEEKERKNMAWFHGFVGSSGF